MQALRSSIQWLPNFSFACFYLFFVCYATWIDFDDSDLCWTKNQNYLTVDKWVGVERSEKFTNEIT